jgi:transposase-like protein
MSKHKTAEHYALAYDWFLALRGDTTLKNIAKTIDVDYRTVRDWAKASEPVTRGPNPYKLDIAKEILDKGLGYTEAAKVSGISRGILSKKFPGMQQDSKFHARNLRVRMSQEDIARMEQLLDDGASYAEVARTIGCSARAVARYFPNRGWTEDQTVEFMTMMRKTTKQTSWNKITGEKQAQERANIRWNKEKTKS